MKNYSSPLQLYDDSGRRKYLNTEERTRFLVEAENWDSTQHKLFYKMLFYSGARISEVLNITKERIDSSSKCLVIESLKKRQSGVFRQIPLPDGFCIELESYIKGMSAPDKIWKFSRRTASRYIEKIMRSAKIYGPQASSKGLRHGFAVHCVTKNVPLSLIKKWLGHASISTTEIYLDIVGLEERQFAERIWDD